MAQEYRLTLDLQWFAQEKTEKATPKKRQDARKKGQVAKTMELPSALVMLGGFGLLALYGPRFGSGLAEMFASSFTEYMLWDVTRLNIGVMFSRMLLDGVLLLLPVFGIAIVMALAANYAQIGFLFTGKPLQPKFSKLNPIQGVRQILSLRSVVELVKALLKITIIGAIVFSILWGARTEVLSLAFIPLPSALQQVASLTMQLGLYVAAALVVLALFDYAYQKWDYEKKLRMSKQEVKDEYKKTEGDPLIKQRIREKQRRMAFMRMMQEVPKADVVVTNPTHYAVALRYDGETMDAPHVVAKGADYVALRIKQIAEEHGVPLMENKPLARALYAQVEIGEAIPQQLFQAVAEVLAYVYKAQGKAPPVKKSEQ